MFRFFTLSIQGILLLASFSQLVGHQAYASEITSKSGEDPNFIQVISQEKDGNIELGFRYCTVPNQAAVDCSTVLGKKDFYTVKDLRKQKTKQEWESAESAVADIVVIAGTAAAGAITGGAIGAAIGAGGADFQGLADLAGGAVIGAPVGGAIGIIIAKAVDALNPFYHGRKAKVISTNLITGQDIEVSSVEDYAKQLSASLDNIK